MKKVKRFAFDIICIVAIIIFPYFLLKYIGIVDYVEKNI